MNIYPEKFGVGAFFLKTRWNEPEIKELGTYVRYQFNDTFGVKGNFLNKSSESNASYGDFHDKIYSIQAKIRPLEKMDIDLEYGVSDSAREEKFSDSAYRIDIRGQFSSQAWYSFEKIHAGPKYFAYYNDADYTAGTIAFPIYQKLRGNFSCHSLKDNLDLDPGKGTANREVSYRAGISYPFPFGTTISLDYEDLHKEDALLPRDFNFKEKGVTVGLGQTFHKFSLQTYVERGELKNKLLDNQNSTIERYSLYAYFYPSDKQTYTFYTIVGQDRYSESLARTKSFGISSIWNFTENLKINLSYQKNNPDSDKRREQDHLLSTLMYTLPNKHSIILNSDWVKNKGTKEEKSSFFIAYTIPLGIPVSKKKSIGILKGRVYDGEKAQKPPLQDVIVTANGTTAVTNQKGEFIFPSLKPGTYFLRVEKGSIGLHRVTSEKLPLMAKVKGGETTQINIAVVNSCKISGRLVVVAFNNVNNHERDNVREAGGLAGILVEIRNGKEVLRGLTDESGRFSFEDIRPGEWTLKVYPENLPVNHYLEKEEFHFELKPEEEKKVTGNILPRLRQIQIIDEGEIKQEFKIIK